MPNEPNRWYCFTINRPTPDDDKQLLDMSTHARYLVYAEEHFEDPDLTPHYQGYVEFDKPKRFTWVKRIIPRAHIEPRYGSRDQARNYCFKECNNPVEFGGYKADRQGQRNDLVSVQRQLDSGSSIRHIAQNHFGTWCRNRNSLSAYADMIRCVKRNWKTKIVVYWGHPGSGKTRRVYEECPDVADMHFANGFWSPYFNEESVLIDDFDDSMMSRCKFLKLTDRYPMKIRVLHGWAEWVPKMIYITSNTDPAHWYNGDTAVTRRITAVHKIELLEKVVG